MTDNAIVHRSERLERFGDRAEIREMFDRIKQMIPGAEKAPDSIILAAAQKAVAHGIDLLNDEMYLMQVQGRWVAHVGIAGLRRNADGKYMFEDSGDYPRRLTDAEIKADVGKETKGAIGIEVRMFNLIKARECKELGIPYFPRRERGYWFPGDNVPATRTGAWVAQKRAEKMALRAEFALEFQKDRDEEEIIAHLQRKLRDKDQAEAPIMRPQLTEDDRRMDAMLFDDEPASPQPDEIEDGDYRQPPPSDAESFDNPWDDEPPAKPQATQAQLDEIDELGRQVYGEQWGANIPKLAQWASTGNVSRLEDLLAVEADKAIGGLKKKLPEAEPV